MRIGELEIDDKARSQTNTLILGSPGFGKSKLLEFMMREDLALEQPFAFLGLHSASCNDMVNWCADNNYLDRNLVLIDPSDGDYAKGMNFFRKIPGIDLSVQVGEIVETIMIAMGNNPNENSVIFKLFTAMFMVMLENNLTLDSVFVLFADRDAFNKKVEALSDSKVIALWEGLKKIQGAAWESQIAPTITRLFRIIRSDTIRRFLCVNDDKYNLNLNFKDTILFNCGTSGRLDADAQRVFVSLVINHFYQKAKLRKGRDGEKPRPYYLYVDEWVLAPTETYRRIAAECRKFGLLLILASQDLAQIRDYFSAGFAESLLTLCQMQVCFGGLNDNASRLAREWRVPAAEVKHLAQREFFAKLPREQARKFVMPEMFDPYVPKGKLKTFERRVAKKKGALPLEQVDAKLKTSHNEGKPTVEDTQDGWAIQ